MQVSAASGTLQAREVLARAGPAAPGEHRHAGFLSRGPRPAAWAAGWRSSWRVRRWPAQSCSAEGLTATLDAGGPAAGRYHLLVAAAVTPSGDPLAAAQRELDEATRAGLDQLKAEHQAWWRDYWGRSFLRLSSPDQKADRLCAAYHVHLYTLGCVNRGPYPAKWDGGPGLMRGDERNWGLSEWVQEIRFTYLPLYQANRLDMARG